MTAPPIYLDHNATTPCDPRVAEAMRPYFGEIFGNSASRTHRYGQEAGRAVDEARGRVASLIGARNAASVIFTSGATESNNLVLKGVARATGKAGDHLVTQATEHKCVLESCKALRKEGFRVTVLPVDREGRVDPGAVADAIDERTLLVSVMYANNEIGTVQPVRAIASVCRERGVLFHCDAVQAVGHLPVDVEADGIDLLSLSAHKMYGPKGVGALYRAPRRPAIRLRPLLHGGGHEEGLRSGTLNVPGIVGLGEACAIASAEREQHAARVEGLRDRLRERLWARLDGLRLNGHPDERLPNNLNVTVARVDGTALLMALEPTLALATGSACASSTLEPSYVLKAIGVGDEAAHASLRIGLGRGTTEAEVDEAVERIGEAVDRLRGGGRRGRG